MNRQGSLVGLNRGKVPSLSRRFNTILIKEVSTKTIRRLARQGGAKELPDYVYQKLRRALEVFFSIVLDDIMVHVRQARRFSVDARGIFFVLQHGECHPDDLEDE